MEGDKNVYYIDWQTYFGDHDRRLCTVDRTHPNDLGFYRMATVILPTMKKMFNIEWEIRTIRLFKFLAIE